VHKLDLAAILSTLVGISALAADSTFKGALTAILGPDTSHVLSILSIVGLVGGQVLRVVGSPSSTPSGIITTPPAPTKAP
jgi:hypothetical protein